MARGGQLRDNRAVTTSGADLPAYLAGLRLRGRRVVVLGGGRVARRRLPALIDAGAEVLVIAPEVAPAVARMAQRGVLAWAERTYRPGDLAGAWYVLAATDVPEVNAQAARRSRAAADVLRTSRRRPGCDGLDPGDRRGGWRTRGRAGRPQPAARGGRTGSARRAAQPDRPAGRLIGLAAPIRVDDPSDERLADYVRLRETTLRRSLESERGLFIAEGEKVIRRAVEAGHRPRSFLLAERWLPGLADLLHRWPEVPVYLVTEQLAEQVTGFHVHRGALASLHREQRHQLADVLRLPRLVVLEDVVDHTNVGAILRSVAGLGWDGVLLSPRTADPLYRRSIKVGMGAVFSLPWARLDDWHSAPELLARGRLPHDRPVPEPGCRRPGPGRRRS